MDLNQIIERLELRTTRLTNFLPERKRLFFKQLEAKFQNRAILLHGPRGVGKTTFLLLMAKRHNLLYISGDDPLLLTVPLQDLLETILINYPGVIIDEIHFMPNWSAMLKFLYDSFPNKTIWISDSSSVLLRKSVDDLSRRFVLLKLPLMSLREYIHFEAGIDLEVLDSPFENLAEYTSEILRQVDILNFFKDYREKGTRPFYIEGNFKEKLLNTLEKTIYYDITHLLNVVHENHFGVMKAIISHLAYSKIQTFNVESMCRQWAIGKPKLYELLHAMEESGVINIAYKDKIEKPYSKGAKIFFADPALYYALEGEIGNFREAFTIFALKERGKILASKNEEEADFIFEGAKVVKLEIWGKNKRSKSSDFVVRDDIDLPIRNTIPLWTLGMLW
ncbi:ATP-binding protein [Thermotoga profunda]|uniref:ATP-binding protein n=1 Tax=Thermotoga profunda TaxID=1508420 RepID=UPI000597B216|nr:ATP-binding protein [Thermotoga profunda]